MKVLIYRGDALQGEYELHGNTVQIGRSAENDIRLEDPSKGVSRHHAEIRVEGPDTYSLVDLGSQNGIWVEGSRVPSVRLKPGVAAAVGPYRLVVADSAAAAPAAPPAEPAIEPTEYSPRVAASSAVEGVGGLLDSPGSPDVTSPPAPAPVVAAEPESRTAGSAVKPRDAGASTVKKAPGPAKPSGGLPLIPIAAAAIVLLAVVGFGAYKFLNKTPKPVWDRDVAQAMVNEGRCDQAMQEQINPALAANPQDADALALKERCAPPPPPPAPPAPTPPPAPDPTVQALDAVEASLTANDCKAALDGANAVLATAPENERAKDLAAKAETCIKAAQPATRTAPAVATAMPPAQGGLDVQKGETPQEYSRRVQAMKKRYEDAVALLQGQRYLQALREFDAIAAVVPSGYLDLSQRRTEARNAMRDESGKQYASGQQSEQRGDFAAAVQHYQRAHDLDPNRDVTADIARINDQKIKLGRDACSKGNAYFLVRRNVEAAAQYDRVLELLPDSDPCYATAKERLAIIRR